VSVDRKIENVGKWTWDPRGGLQNDRSEGLVVDQQIKYKKVASQNRRNGFLWSAESKR
jgi:hypothetical protein